MEKKQDSVHDRSLHKGRPIILALDMAMQHFDLQRQEEEIERQLAVKEISLPQEPTSDDEHAITLAVQMPDGSRRGRRFQKSDKLQYLFDFIDVGRGVKPGSYKLVRRDPRQAFIDGESSSTLSELGLSIKQETFCLELI